MQNRSRWPEPSGLWWERGRHGHPFFPGSSLTVALQPTTFAHHYRSDSALALWESDRNAGTARRLSRRPQPMEQVRA